MLPRLALNLAISGRLQEVLEALEVGGPSLEEAVSSRLRRKRNGAGTTPELQPKWGNTCVTQAG